MKTYLIAFGFTLYTITALSSEKLIEELQLQIKTLNQTRELSDKEKAHYFDELVNRKKEAIEGEIHLQQKLLATPAHERWQVELICRR